MTHNELLAKINHDIEGNPYDEYMSALHAVVELHKPSPIPDWVPVEEKLICWCAHPYPCNTIKVIEKELG